MSDTYEHRHYAGNYGDLLKHLVLHATLKQLSHQLTTTNIHYYETHAGAGGYHLKAQSSDQAKSGILSFKDTFIEHPLLHDFRQTLNDFSAKWGEDFYPGSPRLAHHLLSQQDALHLCELSPPVCTELSHQLCFANVQTYCQDGYTKVLDFIRPEYVIQPDVKKPSVFPIVLIDPPYVQSNETDLVLSLLTNLCVPTFSGIILLWYPNEPNIVHSIEQHLAQLEMQTDIFSIALHTVNNSERKGHNREQKNTTPKGASIAIVSLTSTLTDAYLHSLDQAVQELESLLCDKRNF